LSVPSMDCPVCPITVKAALTKVKGVSQATPPCQTSCRPIMIAEDPHRSVIYEQKFTFN
jgi:mercuric ion binding protein